MGKIVRILQRREVFHRFVFRIEELTLEYERFDGSMSGTLTRLILDRGDSVAILLHDTDNELILLCEQFRAPTYEGGLGWLVELPAGILETGENAEESARRETLEETGYTVRALEPIASVYLSPGGSSERVHIFHAEVSLADRTAAAGGLAAEQEDIRLISLPRDEAFAKAREGQIFDAKTLIALQWLELHGPDKSLLMSRGEYRL
jgi:nudix-type nucleoside diphosphatase (YffH/AdpP family)